MPMSWMLLHMTVWVGTGKITQEKAVSWVLLSIWAKKVCSVSRICSETIVLTDSQYILYRSTPTSNRTAVLSKHDQVNVSKASLILCLHRRGFCGSTLQRLLHTFPEVKNLDEVWGSYWSLLPSPSTIQHACKISIKLFAKEAGELWKGTLRLTNNSFSLNLKHYVDFLHTAVCGRYHT